MELRKINSIEKYVSFYFEEETKSVIVEWEHFFVDKEEFVSVIQEVLDFAENNQVVSWIVDASAARSLIHRELLEKMQHEIIPKLKLINVRFFITIVPRENPFAQLTEQRYRESVREHGITVLVAEDLDGAIEYLKEAEE